MKCKRCGGRLIYADDIHGAYWSCLQCGHEDNGTSRRQAAQGRAERDAMIAAHRRPSMHGGKQIS